MHARDPVSGRDTVRHGLLAAMGASVGYVCPGRAAKAMSACIVAGAGSVGGARGGGA